MTQVVLMLALPIGILFFYFDRKLQRKNRLQAESFIHSVSAEALPDGDKIERIARMFALNQYRIERRNESTLVAVRKHLNIGAAIISFAILPVFYLGIVFFILYYIFIKKPDRWDLDLHREPPLIVDA